MREKLAKINDRYNQLKSSIQSEAMQFKELSKTEQKAFEEAKLKWEAPLFVHKLRPFWWGPVAMFVVCALVVYGIVANSWLFSIAVILFAGFYYYFQQQEVPVVEISLNDFGIRVGNKVYSYNMFQTFWVDYQPPFHKEIHLIPNNRYKYELTLFLDDQDPQVISSFLNKKLPEWADKEKTLSEKINHLIGL